MEPTTLETRLKFKPRLKFFKFGLRVPKTCCLLLVYMNNREPLGCHISFKSILLRKVPPIISKPFKWFISLNSFRNSLRPVLKIRIRWIWLPGSVFTVLNQRIRIQRSKYQQNYPKSELFKIILQLKDR